MARRPPRRGRRGPVRRALRVVLWVAFVPLVLGLLLLVWARTDSFAELSRRQLEERGAELLGEDLSVGGLRVEAFWPPALELREVTVHAREAPVPGLPLVHLDRLYVRLSEDSSLSARRLALRSVVVDGLAARVALVGGRPRDFAALRELLQARAGQKPKKPLQVALGRLDVVDLAARSSVEPLGLGAAVEGVALTFRQDAEGQGAGRLGIEAIDVAYGRIRERAELRSGTFTVRDGLLELKDYVLGLRAGDVGLAGEVTLPPAPGSGRPGGPLRYLAQAEADLDLAVLREALGLKPALRGGAALRLEASGQGGRPRVAFDLLTRAVELDIGPRPKPRPDHPPRLVFRIGDASLRGTVEGDRVVLAPSAVAFGGGEVLIEGGLTLTDDLPWEASLELRDVHLEHILESVTVTHPWVMMAATGTVGMSGTLKDFRGEGPADLRLRDLRVLTRGYDRPGPRSDMLHVPRARVVGRVSANKDRFRIGPAQVRGPAGSNLSVVTDFLFRTKPLGLDITVSGQRFVADDIGWTVARQHVEGVGQVAARIEGPSNDLDISGTLELDEFVFLKWPFGRVAGAVHWHARRDLEFTGLRGRRGETDFEADIRVLFADVRRGGSRERLEIDLAAVVPEGHGRAQDVLPIFFGDKVGATGEAHGQVTLSGPPAALSGRGEVAGREIEYFGERFVTVDGKAEVRSGRLTITEAWARKATGGALLARGSIARGGALSFEFRSSGLDLEELDLVRRVAPPTRRALRNAEALGRPAPTAMLTGRLALDVVLSGELSDLRLAGKAALQGTRYRGMRIGDGGLQVGIRDHRLTASVDLLGGGLRGEAEVGLKGIWPYSYGFAWERLSLDPFLPEAVVTQTEPVAAGATGRLTGSGTLLDAFHDLELHLDDIWLARGRNRIQNKAGRPVVARFADGAIRMKNVELTGPGGRTDLRVEGTLRLDGPLDITAVGPLNIAFVDLAADVFDRAEAESFVLDFRISGPSPAAIELGGKVRIREGLLRTTYFPHAVRIRTAEISLDDKLVRLDRFEGELGGGRIVNAEGSTIRLDRTGYRPREYDLHADCVDCTLRYPSFLPPTRGTARMTFTGRAPDRLVLGGRIDIDELVWRDNVNWQRSVLTFRDSAADSVAAAEAGPALFGLDLRVRSRAESLRMANNIGDFRGTFEEVEGLHVGGDTRGVRLDGLMVIDAGTVRYKGKDFTLEPSTVEFRPGPEWFPYVDLTMATELSTRSEDFRITYFVTGRLDRLLFTPSSEPYLAEKDINSLLLFGLTEEQLSSSGALAGAALGAVGGLIGEAGATSLGQEVSEEARALLPDRFEIVPVYTDTTGSTTFWAVVTKEAVPGLVTLEGGVGLFGQTNTLVPTVGRVKVRFLRNLYLEGSWIRDDRATTNLGNLSLDVKLEWAVD